jgi:hypothetical protein
MRRAACCGVREGRGQETLATMFGLTFLGTSASVPSAERDAPQGRSGRR